MLWLSDISSYVDAKANIKVIYKIIEESRTRIIECSGILTNTGINGIDPTYSTIYGDNDNVTIVKQIHIQWYDHRRAIYVSRVSSWGFETDAFGIFIDEHDVISGPYICTASPTVNGEFYTLATDTSSSDNSNYTH